MITLRECRPEDYEAVAAIATLTRPEPFTAQELMAEDRHARGAGTLHRLVAADEQGRVVGYACAEYMPWSTPGCWDLYAVTHPDHRGRGNGTALYQAVEQIAREGGATALSGWCRSTDPAYFAWAQRRGYESDLLRTESVLDLTAWDGSRFAGLPDRVRTTGLRLVTYKSPEPEEIVAGVYEVERVTAPDVPDYQPDAPFPTFEIYRQQWYEWQQPRLTAVALDGDRVVGTSILLHFRTPGKSGYTGYTGVLREYRGRSVALALKVLTVEFAVAHAIPRLRTNNDFENPAMLAVNQKLGYQLVPGPRRIKKSLS